jgi:hypothetical protein
MNLREVGREGGRWMELAQDHVQVAYLVLSVLNLWVLMLVFISENNMFLKSRLILQ